MEELMATDLTRSTMANPFSAPRLLRNSTYGILGFPSFIFWVTIFSTLLSTSLGLLILGVGFLLLSFTLRVAGWCTSVERWVLAETLGVVIPAQPRRTNGHTFKDIILDPLRDGTYWRDLVFLTMRTVLGIVSFVVVVAAWTFPIFAASSVFWGWATDWDVIVFVLLLGLGAVSLIAGPMLIEGITQLQVAMARSLLGPGHQRLVERASTAQRNRDLSVEAAEAERRRIERDLHDGAQARLATVAMDLGRAKRKLEHGGDPEVASIVDGAHADAKAAIVELRDLARGIHPAVLTDRGLDAALSDLAARCLVPVHLDVQLERRPSAHIESTAYFAVSELLANVSKHSRASNAWVTVRSDVSELRIDVSDDGIGGVDSFIGSGIDGLRDRIASIDGTISIRSPLGDGTSALIELPLTKAAN